MNQYHHGDLRATILSSARQHLSQNSLEAFSLRDLARKVGVSATAVYHHFPSKNSVLQALVVESLQELHALWAPLSLRELGPAYLEYFRERPTMTNLVFHPSFRENQEIADLQDQTFVKLRSCLEGHPDADTAALFLWTLVHGLSQLFQSGILGLPPGEKSNYPEIWHKNPLQLLSKLAPFIDRGLELPLNH